MAPLVVNLGTTDGGEWSASLPGPFYTKEKNQSHFGNCGDRTNIFVTARPVARPWTQWLQRLPVRMHIRTYFLYTYIILCYTHAVYIYILCMLKRKKRLCQYHKIALCNTAQNILHVHTFLKIVVSNHGGSTEATRGCGTVLHVF